MVMTKVKLTLLAATLCTGLASSGASAMPIGNLSGVNAGNDLQTVRWACGPYGRCAWRPNYYRPYGYYGRPRYYGYGYGRPGWRGGYGYRYGRRW